jgi:alkanesulfonate monooxygenase SsuD/methylene tetrahydromethanopterin reductase-like flavin-dependent oxidoreductase (luciferase family)
MPGLVPGIHVFTRCGTNKVVDGRGKPGHDRARALSRRRFRVGGGFPHAAKRAIAYGDGWIPIGGRSDPLDVLPQFRQMAKDAGRDPASLSFDVFGAPREPDTLKRYRESGVDRAIFMLPSKSRDEVLPLLDRSVELMKGL